MQIYKIIGLLFVAIVANGYTDSMNLAEVKALTFYKDRMTTSRRTSPIKQLNCVGGNACKYSNLIETVQCLNRGTDEYGDVQWECSAQLPEYLRLGQAIVSCEGYTSSNDNMKLVGSCGLEYYLQTTTTGTDISLCWMFCIFMIMFCCCWSPMKHNSD